MNRHLRCHVHLKSIESSVFDLQGMVFKMPKVRTFFNIPQIIHHDIPKPAKKKQSVVQNMKGGKKIGGFVLWVFRC